MLEQGATIGAIQTALSMNDRTQLCLYRKNTSLFTYKRSKFTCVTTVKSGGRTLEPVSTACCTLAVELSSTYLSPTCILNEFMV